MMANQRTPLHRAAQEGNAEVAELLIQAGTDVDAKQDKGKSALQLALTHNHTWITEILIKELINLTVNKKGLPFFGS